MNPQANDARALRSLWRRRRVRFALAYLVALAIVALGADLLASSQPLVTSFQGDLYLLPNLTHPTALRPYNIADLLVSFGEGDWLVSPPIPWGPDEQDKGHAALSPPSTRHWLGTDVARRDVLSRLLHGARTALLVGLGAVGLYVLIGLVLGLCAAYFGGFVDAVISRLVETLLAVPVFFLVLAVLGVVERAGIGTLAVVIGAVSWTHVARLVRAEAMRVRGLEFVQAAEALGGSPFHIVFRHLLPNVLSPVLVSMSFGLGSTIMAEASLSFLGFGVPDARASWGGLMQGAMGHLQAWWLVLGPGVAMFLTVLAANVLGEALRDALDPTLADG